jgi:hypothetical protein
MGPGYGAGEESAETEKVCEAVRYEPQYDWGNTARADYRPISGLDCPEVF